MNTIQKRVLTLFSFVIIATSTLVNYTPTVFAAPIATHVRVVGSEKTLWFGDVTTEGCTVSDTDGQSHHFTQPYAICALDAAAKTGGFAYTVKNFGGSLGLFLQSIGSDTGASDFSTFWSYDLNGASASQGISSQLLANGDSVYFHFEDPLIDSTKRAITDGLTYLRSEQQPTGQITGFSGVSHWAAITFAAAGVDPESVKKDATHLLGYLIGTPPAVGASASEWARGILAVTAAGKNPYSFGGVNYVGQLESNYTASQLGATTQVNDDIFGLLALIAAGDNASLSIKQATLTFIIAEQNSDGGFSWSTTGDSDVDDTAAAIQAMIAAQKAGLAASGLPLAIANAKAYVLAAQNADGGFWSLSGEASNASSTAWALMALSALDVTGTPVDKAKAYLRGNQEENGSFKWQTASVGETFTTSYAVLSLTGKYWPVAIYEAEGVMATPTVTPSPTVGITVTPMVTYVPAGKPTVAQRATLLEKKVQARIQSFCNRVQTKLDRLRQRINVLQ
ncbi:MAG: prenyltransferase/squalene oxidase repeat-containing protein [Patescibacteria group bacterium]